MPDNRCFVTNRSCPARFRTPHRGLARAEAASDAATNLLVLGAREGRLGKVIAQLMGHAKVDATLNVYMQIIDGSHRRAADAVGSEMLGRCGPDWAPFRDVNLCALLWKTA